MILRGARKGTGGHTAPGWALLELAVMVQPHPPRHGWLLTQHVRNVQLTIQPRCLMCVRRTFLFKKKFNFV